MPRVPLRGDHLRQVDAAGDPRPRRRLAALLRARALARGDQPADAVAAPARARGARDRRPQDLPRGAAAGRVRADAEGQGARAADRGHALVRPPVAVRGRRQQGLRRRRGRLAALPDPRRASQLLLPARQPARAGRNPAEREPAGVRDLAVKNALETLAGEAAERLRALVERGEELPYDITGPGEGSPFVQYTPRTAPFIRAHASALTGLASFRAARKAIAEAELGEAYLDGLGEPPPEDRERRAEAAVLAFLGRLWDGLGDFTIDDTRLAEAIAELEGSEAMPVGEAEIVVPLAGFHMPTTRLELGMATLVRADTVEVPEEAAHPEGTRKAGWEPHFLAAVRAPDGDEPAAGPGRLLRGVVTTLRLFKEGGVGLAPYAWARSRGDRWQRIPTGVGRPRPGGYRLGDSEVGDLAAFAQGLAKRSGLPSAPSGGG